MSLTQQDRNVAVTTPLGADVLVLRTFHGHEELSQLFQYDLELLSEDPAVRFEDVIGKAVTVRLRMSGDRVRYFNGFVSRFTQVSPLNRYPRYRAVVVPWLWFLTRSADCQIFQKKSVPQILEEVFKKHHFDAYELKLNDTYDPREYCVQYRETAFEFVSRLMEEEGIHYFFTHKDGQHTLVLADDANAHPTFDGYERIGFRPPDDTSKAGERIRDWTVNKEVLTGKYALTDFNFEIPQTSLEVRSEIIREHAEADLEKFDYPGEYQKHGPGDRYARIRIQEIQAHHEVLQGEGDARGVCVGHHFTLEDHPRPDQNRDYLVCATTIDIESDAYATTGSGTPAGEFFRCAFSAIDAGTPFRPARVTRKPRVQGAQTAVVVGPGGEEIYPDKYARVKVQFHWDRYGKRNENSSCWIRVAQVWAGKQWGAIYIPRIGQEVIVEFLEGDPDQPIITGRVYNGEAMPPYALPGNMTQSGIKSRSSKGGAAANFNEIRFEDKMGSEQVYIHAEKNQDNVVENDETTSVGHDRTEKVGNDETLTVGHDQVITIKHDQGETVENNRTVRIGANHNETIGSSMYITVGSSLTETVTLNYAETVGAAMELTVGGALAITVGAAMAETVGGVKTESVGLAKSENIGGNRSLNVGGDLNEKVAKNHVVAVSKDQKTTVAGQQQTTVSKECILNAKKIQLVAEEEIQLKTGSAEITLKKSGDILIKGKKIEVSGSGDIVLKGSQIKEN